MHIETNTNNQKSTGMNIIFNHLYKIDIVANAVEPLPKIEGENDLKSYVLELVTNVLDGSDRRGYVFERENTEIKTLLTRILLEEEGMYERITEQIAARLLAKEVEAQAKIEKLNVKVQKGVVVISLVQFSNDKCKILISKADYDDFIDAVNYKKRAGLPLRKKIFKAFIADVNEENEIINTSVYDTNSTFSVYWWRDFLELREVNSDEYNTKKAFDVIEAKILTPIKRTSKTDYINLWNTSVHYFRIKSEFILEDFIGQVFTDYLPFDSKVDVDCLIEKARSLPEKHKFDSRFSIIQKLITKRFKKTITLTPQIELHLKEDIDIKTIIKVHESIDGAKYVMIRSNDGFEYFKDSVIAE
jgi:hypothetical protein